MPTPKINQNSKSLKGLKLHKNQLFFPVTAVIFTTLLGFFTLNFLQIFTPESSYADTHTDSASGAYNGTTYTLETTVSDLNLELKTLPTGNATYGAQTVNVATNAPGGYELYVNTSGVLTNTSDSNSTIPSITGSNQALDMNTWGYTTTTPNENKDTAGAEAIWSTAPSTLTRIDSNSSAVTGKEKTLYYGVKADNTLADGTYTGTITYTTIANDAASDTLLSVSPTSGTAGTATTITITTSLMTTENGISASDIAAKVGNYTCSSVAITSTTPLIFTCNTSTSLTAGTYNVEVKVDKYSKTYTKSSAITFETPNDLSTITDMQTSTVAANCRDSKETTSTSDVITYELVDSRNSQKYYIRKFKLNNTDYCMMVENLYLVGGTKLTSATSNVSDNFTLPNSTTSGYSTNNKTTQMYNGGRFRISGGNVDGSYYNWCAATAGTGGCYDTSRSAGTYDICPKYWRLPTYFEQVYLDQRIDSIGINTFFANSTGTARTSIYAGYYLNGTLTDAGYRIYWWSNTEFSSTPDVAGYLGGGSGALWPYANGAKYTGVSVRCLVQAAS